MISEEDRSEAVARLRIALSQMLDCEDWYEANDSLFDGQVQLLPILRERRRSIHRGRGTR